MTNLHTDLLNQVEQAMAEDIRDIEDREIIQEMGLYYYALTRTSGANLDHELYYLYVHLLKWDWKVIEVKDMDGATIIKIESPTSARIKNIMLER